ncbi:MAG: ABC transporter ATP-binding protein [Gammaproteobacteria bacterium]|nr:ABC transporter ATP-binding protein [Gammaproteobacteria bacterium]NNL62529.1 ABC transporter ATP-binding protein [Woeseiaceae bacterium]
MSADGHALFSCTDLCIDVAGRVLVDGLAFDAAPGELIAILGQNGAGKSLTMHTLAGLRPAMRGQVRLRGEDVTSARRLTVARHLALLPQHVDDIFPSTVLATAMIGRHPHVGRWQWETAEDLAIGRAALAAVDLDALAARDVLTLSGGERRRLAIAQVLAQQPEVYLLDEPSNHLDPQHQIDALRLFRRRADDGAAVIASLHDVNLAVRYADRCLLLYGDGRWDIGAAADVLDETRLTELYRTRMEAVDWRATRLFVASGDEAP